MTNQRISRVTKEDVKFYKDRKNQELVLFESFMQGLEINTIYYEDFFEGTKISDIDLLIKFDETVTKKLPDYKQSVFVNYEEIKDWFYNS
jgi:predicted nucleotidyltransferase